jgi:hypothetical protein
MPEQSGSTPQFQTAEYSSASGANTCRSCNRTISGPYYRVNGALACDSCVQQLQNQIPKDSHAAFVKALIFGFGGAIIGLILYAAFGMLTGLMIGYVSLAVGYIVGKGMLMGSGGLGGRRYQIAAVLFTYFAVSMAAIPLGISQYAKEKNQRQHGLVRSSSPTVTSPHQESVSSDSSQTTAEPDNPPPAPQKPKSGLGAALFGLLLLGLTSPFLELSNPMSGLIGLVILFVGLRIAWKLTAGKAVEILGPFGESVPPPPLG